MLKTIVKGIESPFKNSYGMLPKVTYITTSDHYGVFYSPVLDKFYYTESYGTIVEVEPFAVIIANEEGLYPVPDDNLEELIDCFYSGEADDLSCYVYFREVE